jgi:hypothetical protein
MYSQATILLQGVPRGLNVSVHYNSTDLVGYEYFFCAALRPIVTDNGILNTIELCYMPVDRNFILFRQLNY